MGRPAAGRALDATAVDLAVAPSMRHQDTAYDELQMAGLDRADARKSGGPEVERVLHRRRSGAPAEHPRA